MIAVLTIAAPFVGAALLAWGLVRVGRRRPRLAVIGSLLFLPAALLLQWSHQNWAPLDTVLRVLAGFIDDNLFVSGGPLRASAAAAALFAEARLPSLFANAMLLVGALAVLLALRWRTAPGASAADDDSGRFAWKNAARSRLGRRTHGLWLRRYFLGAFAIWCVFVFLVYAAIPLGRGWLPESVARVRDILGPIVWAGPLVAFALFFGASRPIAIAHPDRRTKSDTPGEREPASIKELFDYLRNTYAEHLLLVREPPAQQASTASKTNNPTVGAADLTDSTQRILATLKHRKHAALTSDRQKALDTELRAFQPVGEATGRRAGPGKAPLLLVQEDLAEAHLVVAAELLESAQNRGHATLAIAPEWMLERLKRQFEEIVSRHSPDVVQDWHLLPGVPLAENKSYHFILASEAALEALFAGRAGEHAATVRAGGARDRFLRSLRQLLIFEFHLLDPAMLRLRLAQVAAATGAKGEIRIFCQSEDRAKQETTLANSFAPIGVAPARNLRIAAVTATLSHQLVWRNSLEALDALTKNEFRRPADGKLLEIAPQLAVPHALFGVEAAFYDSAGRRLDVSWGNVLEMANADARLREHHGALQRMKDRLGEFGDRTVNAVVIEDYANLAVVLRRHANFSGQREILVNIICHDYPMRDWFLEKVEEASGGAWDERIDPRLPAPVGATTELAFLLAGEFDQGGASGLSQFRLQPHFVQLVKPELASRFGLYATANGLKELFYRETGERFNIESQKREDHDFTLTVGGGTDRLSPRLTAAARRSGADVTTEPDFTISRSDHGITYADGTHVAARGGLWRIDEVDGDRIVVTAQDTFERAREDYLFHRQFHVDFQRQLLAPEDKVREVSRGELSICQVPLRGKFSRWSPAWCSWPEGARPLAKGTVPRWSAAGIHIEPQSAAVFLVRLVATAAADIPGFRPEAIDCTAFTLASTLQDVLFSLFPQIGYRMAVLSPQASPAIKAALDAGRAVDSFVAMAAPRLVAHDAGHQKTAPVDPDSATAAITAWLDDCAWIGRRPKYPDGSRILDLLVVEDSLHDLGVVKAIEADADWTSIVEVWHSYLEWLARQPNPERGYHAWGGDSLPSLYDYEAAASVTRSMLGRGSTAAGGGGAGRA